MAEVRFNPRRLTFARRRRGFSKVQLATELAITERALVAYETGEYAPTDEALTLIATCLKFPIQFFSGPDLEVLAAADVSFRSLTKMSAKQRESALTQAEVALYLYKWLEERFELPELDLPNLTYENEPEAAAEALREHWGLGQLPIRNMVHLLESKGIRVFSISLPLKEVDALSSWKAGIPFVFLNGAKSAERSRFDAAHELGHLVLHRHGSPAGRIAEDQAQRFASAFLMPRGSVLARAPKLATINELIKLKKVFGVSLSAISYRLHSLSLLSDWHYRSLAIQISKRGFRTSEPEEGERERSLLLPMLLERLHREGLTYRRIAEQLGLPLYELENVLFSLVMKAIEGGKPGPVVGPPAHLRLVK
jgi:Zn-dependent peptidase ImmA (M78 family)/DNA-binding XRE family transcriptional regulator